MLLTQCGNVDMQWNALRAALTQHFMPLLCGLLLHIHKQRKRLMALHRAMCTVLMCCDSGPNFSTAPLAMEAARMGAPLALPMPSCQFPRWNLATSLRLLGMWTSPPGFCPALYLIGHDFGNCVEGCHATLP